MINVLVIVGHSKTSQGAVAYNGLTEYEFNKDVANTMLEYNSKYSKIHFDVEYRDKNGFTGIINRVVDSGILYDMSIELHFNSFNGTARGCECLVMDENVDDRCVIFADILTDSLSREYGIKERRVLYKDVPGWSRKIYIDGVRLVSNGDRGYANLYQVNIKAGILVNLLIEPCFANLKTYESESIIEQPDRYGMFLARTIAEDIYGISPEINEDMDYDEYGSRNLRGDSDIYNIDTMVNVYSSEPNGAIIISSRKLYDRNYKYIATVPFIRTIPKRRRRYENR